MSEDRDWMYRRVGEKAKKEYLNGVEEFLDFAFSKPEIVDNGRIRCPSVVCDFLKYKSRDDVQMCLLHYGFVPNYTTWTKHGESPLQDHMVDDVVEGNENWPREMVMEAARPFFESNENPPTNPKKFYDLLHAADEPLWEGCEAHTKLSASTLLLHLKSEYGLSNAGFTAFLKLIKEMLPNEDKLPKSFYECKALMKDLGLPYEKIHACEKDCILFRGEYAHLDSCPKCHSSRYKMINKIKGKKCKLVPKKVLRYFPLIPRLQRLYLSSKTAEPMRWHKEKRCDVPGELRHPADGEAWKDFDRKYPDFAEDARSIRLAGVTDGFNPFGHSSTPHSTWPVFLVPYNLPPWMCMKEEYMFMSMVIPGPKSPGRELDVYLQPLIDELNTLWAGVNSFDAFKEEEFNLRAALIWTISDFPALAMLKGWSTHGGLACPVCMDNSLSFYLKHGRKQSWFGCHRRWLKRNHPWRKVKIKFNMKREMRDPPRRLTGTEELNFLTQFESHSLGKGEGSDGKMAGFGSDHNWTKKSIFFQLPYWSQLLIRHNIDVMHTEKNIFDNVFNTVMNVKGKSKDNLKARMDLQELGIRAELHPVELSNGKIMIPKAKYTLTSEQVKQVCKWLKSLKVPDGFSSNISRCVSSDTSKIMGLKSHDCHVLMEMFMPLAFRDLLPKEVWEPLNALSQFFRDLCSKVYKEEVLEKLEAFIADTLCKLEMIFPPSFFDSMEHVAIHLAYEAKLGGPVQYRWMYPFERCMYSLKRKVRNRASPEGSIAEAFLIDELVHFYSRYFDFRIQTKFNRKERNDDGGEVEMDGRLSVFCNTGCPFGKPKVNYLTQEELNAAHLYVLSNCEEVYNFISEHMELLRELHPDKSDVELQKEHDSSFIEWFENRVKEVDVVDHRLKLLAKGPSREVIRYNGFKVNGYKFHSKELESRRATQNSGVLVRGSTYNESEKDYYGHLIEVVKLEYFGKGNSVCLFKCEWYDVEKGQQTDKYGYTTVNRKSKLRSYEPFVIASQALQVFYVDPVSEKSQGWSSVIIAKARSTYDVVEHDDFETYQEEDASNILFDDVVETENFNLCDYSQPGEEIDRSLIVEEIEREVDDEVEGVDECDDNFINDEDEDENEDEDDEEDDGEDEDEASDDD